MTLQLNNVSREEARVAIQKFIDDEPQGRIAFSKDGVQYFIFASSETETVTSS